MITWSQLEAHTFFNKQQGKMFGGGPAQSQSGQVWVYSGGGPSREGLLRTNSGARLLRAFKDLGVQQLAGDIEEAVLERRIQATAGRLGRLGGLPLPHAKRLLVVAAPGAQAATYAMRARRPARRWHWCALVQAEQCGEAGGLARSS